jgi:hypothetical protein
MLKHFALSALLLLVLPGFGTRHAFADIYKYVNEAGETSFADNLQSVPEKYRATAVNTTAREEQKLVKPPQIQYQKYIATTQETPSEGSADKMTFTTRLLMTAGMAIVWFALLFAIKKTGEFKGREKVLPTTRIALACIFLAYLVMVHGKDVVNLFTMAGNKIEAVQEKQAQRGKKAGAAIKALNQLVEEAGKQPPAPDQGEEKNN